MEAILESAAKLVTAIAALAWPIVFAVLLIKLYEPIKGLVEAARARKFSIKIAGNELTMEEASKQQIDAFSDLQSKVAELEKRLAPVSSEAAIEAPAPVRANKRILWVDDSPKNNSFLVASFENRGIRVDTALTTDEGVVMFRRSEYDAVISDMGRPENEKAGIDLTRAIKQISPDTPIYIFCGRWAAMNLRKEALAAGVAEITSSGSTLARLVLA
jgi:CheY-like chemotaxis protein